MFLHEENSVKLRVLIDPRVVTDTVVRGSFWVDNITD